MKKNILYPLSLILFFAPLFWESREPIPHFYGIGVFSIILLTWLVVQIHGGKKIKIPRIVPLFFVFIALQAILSYSSPVQDIGLIWVIFEIFIIIFFIFTLNTIENDQGRFFWENILIGSALIFASIDIINLLSWYGNWFQISGSYFSMPPLIKRASGNFLSHPNLLSSYLNLAIPLVFVRVIRSVNKKSRILWLSNLVILLIGNYLTYSRSGWLSLAGGLVVTSYLIYSIKFNFRVSFQQLISSRRSSWYWILLGFLLVISFVGLFFLISWQLSISAHGTLGDRLDIYSYAFGWIKNSPLWGYGTRATPFIFALRGYAIGGDEIYHTHNLWLQIILEAGIIGFLSVILLLGFFIKACRSAWLNWLEDPIKRTSLAAYIGVGVAILIHSFFDMAFVKLVYNMALVTIIALVYSLAPQKEFICLRNKITIPVVIGVLLGGAFGLSFLERSINPYWRGKEAAIRGDWYTAKEEICLAANINQTNAFYSFQCALANSYVAAIDNNSDALSESVRYQRQALALNPQWYIHWANLASYEWELGERPTAIEHMQKALDLAPNRVFLSTNLAWMNEQVGNDVEALESYKVSYCANPWYEWSAVYQQSRIFQQAAQEDCDPEIDILANSPYQKQLIQGWQSYQAGNYAEAESHLQNAAKADPQSGVPYSYLALVHFQNGNIQKARNNIQIALLIQLASASFHKIAADLEFTNNNDVLGYKHLESAFYILEHSPFSYDYYWNAYFDHGLLTDVAPPFLYASYGSSWIEAFEKLSSYLRDNGKLSQMDRVNQWLKINELSH